MNINQENSVGIPLPISTGSRNRLGHFSTACSIIELGQNETERNETIFWSSTRLCFTGLLVLADEGTRKLQIRSTDTHIFPLPEPIGPQATMPSQDSTSTSSSERKAAFDQIKEDWKMLGADKGVENRRSWGGSSAKEGRGERALGVYRKVQRVVVGLAG